MPHIYAVALLSATAFVWFDAANFGAQPTLVGRERIVVANSAIWSTNTLITIIGPSIGGVLATTIGPAWAISLDTLSYALAAVALMRIPRALSTPRTAAGPPESIARWTVRDIREGLTFLWNHRLVRTPTVLRFGVSLSGGAVTSLLVVYGVQALALSTDDSRLGLLFTAGALGALLASLGLLFLTKHYGAGQITLVSLLANLVVLIGVALAPTFGVGLVLYLSGRHGTA